jgi:hypothetical protein
MLRQECNAGVLAHLSVLGTIVRVVLTSGNVEQWLGFRGIEFGEAFVRRVDSLFYPLVVLFQLAPLIDQVSLYDVFEDLPLRQIDNLAMREIQGNYGFIPNTNISTHLNACHELGDTPMGVYFTHFTNKHFHDLTTKKSIPAAAATVLGVGLKFIPVPKKFITKMMSTKLSSDSTEIST